MKRISKQIKESFEAATPNVLPSILSDCEAAKADAIPVPVKKTAPFVLRLVASAAVLALLVGVGALAGGLFRRPSVQNPSNTETQPSPVYPADSDILAAFCETTGQKYDKIKDKAVIRHYWNYGNLYFFYVDNLWEYPKKLCANKMENMEFLFETEQRLYLYKEGVCADFMIREQCHKLLTIDALEAFYLFHKAENAMLYDPDSWPAKTDLDCPAHLTAEKRIVLEAALGLSGYNTDDYWFSKSSTEGIRYYGTYEGYDVLFQPGEFFAETTKVIANQAFGHSSSFSLTAYKNGEFVDLNDLYERGLISKESIAAAREYHNQATSPSMVSTCRPEPIDKGHEEYIQQFWAQICDEPFGTWYSEDNTSGDWRVYPGYILFYTGGEQEEVFTTLQVGSYSFSHPTTFQMYVYAPWGPGLMEITEYYNQFGADNYLAKAAAMHMETQNALFGEGWIPECDHEFENTILLNPNCIQVGKAIYNCKKCGYNYTTDLPMLEHDWYADNCSTAPICHVCGQHGTEPVHTNKTDIRTTAPTEHCAGVEEYACADCGKQCRKLYGKTGEYKLDALTNEISQYAQMLGFTYREEHPGTSYAEYEYTQLYSIVESLGGHQVLREKAYDLIVKLYDDAYNSPAGSTEPYELWFTVEYLSDNSNSVGAFRIHVFIAS